MSPRTGAYTYDTLSLCVLTRQLLHCWGSIRAETFPTIRDNWIVHKILLLRTSPILYQSCTLLVLRKAIPHFLMYWIAKLFFCVRLTHMLYPCSNNSTTAYILKDTTLWLSSNDRPKCSQHFDQHEQMTRLYSPCKTLKLKYFIIVILHCKYACETCKIQCVVNLNKKKTWPCKNLK
jgi:hypothetical protein